MKAYVFFSVHEKLFAPVCEHLRRRWGVHEFSGFVWGEHQREFLARTAVRWEPLTVFSRDILPVAHDGKRPEPESIARVERELGYSLNRMIFSERHLLQGRSYEQVTRLVEVALAKIEEGLRRASPDFIITEDISCFHSYAHWVIARKLGIPFWCIGSARLPNRVVVYRSGLQRWEATNARFDELLRSGVPDDLEQWARGYVDEFRVAPKRPTGMETRARRPSVSPRDARLWGEYASRHVRDPGDPTIMPPWETIWRRAQRLFRERAAELEGLFEQPATGERYVVYPIHFQPEASTLVQAPYYLDQISLIADIAKSLPAGHRLYVKEHLSNRGRRPLSFYRSIKDIFGVRLLGPDVDGWELIRRASAVAVITGTMGWEALLFGRPVITFGEAFFNVVPGVHVARNVPKDGWSEVFRRAIDGPPADQRHVLAYLAALRTTSYPGFMKNPNTFPEVLRESNVRALADAVGAAVGLGRSASARDNPSAV